MAKKLTTNDFIIRSQTIHGDKYDYSKSNYISKDDKLVIICPEHGEFLQSANNHWKGKGCPSCGKNKKLTISEFIKRSVLLHGVYYDYSKVVFDNIKSKIIIICPEHGEFTQSVEKHLAGQGCRECAKLKREATCIEKYGVDHPMKSKIIKEKLNKTMIENYGVDNYFKTDEGKQVVKEYHILHSDELKEKRESTMLEKYGVKNALQSEIFVDKMKNTNILRYGVPSYFQTDAAINAGAEYRKVHWDEMLEKQKQTNIEKYGVECVLSSDEIQERIIKTNIERYGSKHPTKTDIVKKRTIATNIERYGVSYPMQSDEIKAKARATNIERYGSHHPLCSQNADAILGKINQKKHENRTFNTSEPEERLYLILCDKFGENDICRQYRDNRYPFMCDFYIKSLDLFVELNASWTHGGHWFDENNQNDIEKLNLWRVKAIESEYYAEAITTWVKRDVKKRNIAEKNNINYFVIWEKDVKNMYEIIECLSI